MVRPRSLARVILALALIASGVIYAQQVQPNQLLVFISAVDASGAPVTDLKPEEVAFTENGAPGKVVSLDRHQLPIKLTIAIDNGRESTTALAALRAGLTGLVEALPADVEVTLITMSQPQTVVRPTTDRAQITQGISRFGSRLARGPEVQRNARRVREAPRQGLQGQEADLLPHAAPGVHLGA